MNRAQRMLRVLSDGKKHSRQEILLASDKFYLTNNAAAELRVMGYDVKNCKERGEEVYWLAGALDEASSGSPSRSGSDVSSSASALLSSTVETPSQVSGGSGALHLFDPPVRGAYTKEAA